MVPYNYCLSEHTERLLLPSRPGLRQSSSLRGFEVCEWGEGGGQSCYPRTFREREVPGPYLWRSSCMARSLALPSLLSGSTFSFLESSHIPSLGPLLSAPTQDLGTRGAKNIECHPRLPDKKCPLCICQSQNHIYQGWVGPALGGILQKCSQEHKRTRVK